MSLIYQILIPTQITVPCIYPSSDFDYNFKLLDGEMFKIRFEPYPMNYQYRFFTGTINHLGQIGSGHMSVEKDISCDEFPAIKMDFTWNNSNYLLVKKNNFFVITNTTIDSNSSANDDLYCGYNSTEHSLLKRDSNSLSTLNGDLMAAVDSPCPSQTKYASLGIAVDCSVVMQSKGDISAVIHEVLTNLAQTNIAYGKQFNVQLILSVLDIRTSCSQVYSSPSSPLVSGEFDRWNQPCIGGYAIVDRVSDFSKWRGSRTDLIDLWHLFSACATDSKVGLAWPSSVCQNSAKPNGAYTYSGTSISTRQKSTWKVMAHEIAHNFGAAHDCLSTCDNCKACSGDCDCKGQYIMNPNQNVATDGFSSGTIQDVCNTLPGFACLKTDANISAFKENSCGNGLVDSGEECDCGDLCAYDKCCTKDCKFSPNSVCSDKNQGCCTECQFAPKNKVCRIKEGVCDSEEVCSGISGSCPLDKYNIDGSKCTENSFTGNCASKYCTSPDKQCKDAYPESSGACSGFGGQYNDCILTCAVSGGCAEFQSFLIDGTLCGGGYGTCEEGSCQFKNDCNFN
eukprot:NODE_571_length_6574_cov_0.317220.p2 type:complete len:566 gc:universal NODE_571_length_6574_cov_0.317220:446-2143(+)